MSRLARLPGAVAADSPTFSPLYRQIKVLLTRGLQAGEWKPGELIPSETELAARFGVSQGTVRKAIDELAADHLLVRRQGRGTFVATHQEARAQFRFLRLRPDHGGDPGAMSSRVLACRRTRAPVDIARALQLRTGETVVQVRRLLSFDARPVVLDEIWLPGALFRGLTADRLAAYTGPLYALFESEFGIRMIRAAERLRAVAATRATAADLGVAPGEPVLQVERVTYTYEDRPVEVRRGLYATGRHHYFNELI
ncbi:MAG: GntR family transcriptional regulator [Burkholderiaceae bacterium]